VTRGCFCSFLDVRCCLLLGLNMLRAIHQSKAGHKAVHIQRLDLVVHRLQGGVDPLLVRELCVILYSLCFPQVDRIALLISWMRRGGRWAQRRKNNLLRSLSLP
jgi:hypothetical protein